MTIIQKSNVYSSPPTHRKNLDVGEENVLQTVPADCRRCGAAGERLLYSMKIPNFQDFVLLTFNCNNCGFRQSELKPTSDEIPEKGKTITLKVASITDLNRSIFQSSSASMLVFAFVCFLVVSDFSYSCQHT